VTRGALLAARARPDPGAQLEELVTADPVVTHGDRTLRYVAEVMAVNDVTTLPVVDRDDSTRVIGIVSLLQLLHARRRDAEEARERERSLRIRLLTPWGERG